MLFRSQDQNFAIGRLRPLQDLTLHLHGACAIWPGCFTHPHRPIGIGAFGLRLIWTGWPFGWAAAHLQPGHTRVVPMGRGTGRIGGYAAQHGALIRAQYSVNMQGWRGPKCDHGSHAKHHPQPGPHSPFSMPPRTEKFDQKNHAQLPLLQEGRYSIQISNSICDKLISAVGSGYLAFITEAMAARSIMETPLVMST